jgi:hypothetical protein
MRILPCTALVLLALAPVSPSFADASGATTVESRPGAVAVSQTSRLTGTITSIDAATREVTLKGTDGKETVIACGPEVKNFDQLRVGDAVEMESTQALALELKKGSTAEISRTVEGAVASAAPGATPAGVGGVRVRIVAEVMALDPETQTVTLRGPVRIIDLRVDDPEQFKLIAVGDRIEGTYVEALAVAVTPAQTVE